MTHFRNDLTHSIVCTWNTFIILYNQSEIFYESNNIIPHLLRISSTNRWVLMITMTRLTKKMCATFFGLPNKKPVLYYYMLLRPTSTPHNVRIFVFSLRPPAVKFLWIKNCYFVNQAVADQQTAFHIENKPVRVLRVVF